MKQIILSIICIVATVSANAAAIRPWSAGKLTWNDFQGSPGVYSTSSGFRASLKIEPVDTVIGGTKMVMPKVEALMDCNYSFARKDARTPALLRLYQTEFDLLESYRRDLQTELNEGLSGHAADDRLVYFNNLYREKVLNMVAQTDHGTNEEEMSQWEQRVKERLDDKHVTPIMRAVKPGNFSYGLYVGTGFNGTTSSIHDAFSNAWTFSAGLQVGYRRIKVKADITYGQPKISSMNIMGVENQETSDTYASYLSISPMAGFTVFKTDRFSITPFVGCSWTSYGWNVANYKFEKNEQTGEMERKIDNYGSPSLKNFNWRAQVDFEYRFKKLFTTTAELLTGHREQIVSAVRFSPYIIRGIYSKANPGLRGYQLGFTVSIAVEANSIGF